MKKFLSVLFVILLLCGCSAKSSSSIEESSTEPEVVEPEPEPEPEIDPEKQAYYDELNANWDANYEITSDYRGRIYFESGLIDLDFVQGKTNDTYLRRDWKTMNVEEEGSIFMDYRNTLDDENVIIYGHNVAKSYEPSMTHMFTPLHQLKEEANYSENQYVYLQLENEIRQYQIAAVYYCNIITANGVSQTEENLQYYWTTYDPTYFETYHDAVKEAEFYDTGVDFTIEDKLLTLQTCVEGRSDLRLIVIAKLVGSEQTR